MVTRDLGSASSLPITESTRQPGGYAQRFLGRAHSWVSALVSRVKKARHWALFGEANKSQVNGPNIIENLSKASRLSAYSTSSKDNLGKTGVSRGLGATNVRVDSLGNGYQRKVTLLDQGEIPSCGIVVLVRMVLHV
eukprot:scaffold2858_cov659-Pavlova_lutheri.AAC.185